MIRQGCDTPDDTALWTPATRRQHSRVGLCYGSDLPAAEWEILAPFLPAASGCGSKWAWPMREIFNAICYMLRGGMTWRLLPSSFSPLAHGLSLVRKSWPPSRRFARCRPPDVDDLRQAGPIWLSAGDLRSYAGVWAQNLTHTAIVRQSAGPSHLPSGVTVAAPQFGGYSGFVAAQLVVHRGNVD